MHITHYVFYKAESGKNACDQSRVEVTSKASCFIGSKVHQFKLIEKIMDLCTFSTRSYRGASNPRNQTCVSFHQRQPVYTSRYRGAYYGKKCEAGYSSWSFSYYFFANPKDSMLCFHPGRYVCDIIFKRKSKNYNAKGIAKKIEKWFPNNPLVRKSSPDGIKYAEKSRSNNKFLGLPHFVWRRTSAKPHYVVL